MSDIKTKFINDPENITAELLEGYALAYPNQVKLAAENIVVRANPKGNDKVAIVTLGGSGHEPASWVTYSPLRVPNVCFRHCN